MGLKFDVARSASQAESLTTKQKTVAKWGEDYGTAIMHLATATDALQGQAYDAARNWFNTVELPLTRGLVAYHDGLAKLATQFHDDYLQSVAHQSLDEDELKRDIQQAEAQVSATAAAMRALQSGIDAADSKEMAQTQEVVMVAQQQIAQAGRDHLAQLQAMLARLKAYEDSSQAQLAAIKGLADPIESGLAVMTGKNSPSHGGSLVVPATGMAWAGKLNDAYVNDLVDQVKCPADLHGDAKTDYKNHLRTYFKSLMAEGWDSAGILKYGEIVRAHAKGLTGEKLYAEMKLIDQRAHRIGSETFTAMLDAGFSQSAKDAANKLDMFYNIVGARIDANNFMQLDKVAAEGGPTKQRPYEWMTSEKGMEHYMQFVGDFSATIQRKYAWNSGNQLEPWIKNVETGLNAYHPGKQMTSIYDHQMRYWLDRPLIQFINSDYLDKHYAGKSKFDRYQKWLEDIGDKAGHPGPDLHRRGATLDSYLPPNQKITCDNNHLEAVFSPDGTRTVSMWNSLEPQADGTINSDSGQFVKHPSTFQDIANTDSANYAQPNKKSSGSAHESLDVGPAGSSKGLEATVRVDAKNKFPITPLRKKKIEQKLREKEKNNGK